ncbi:hypothetical protein F4678DRAFT_460726 [Xylaria arbuscula]|nr:hypothetical protein F4678DRAFT_460726 [Xylaria arbuscula]
MAPLTSENCPEQPNHIDKPTTAPHKYLIKCMKSHAQLLIYNRQLLEYSPGDISNICVPTPKPAFLGPSHQILFCGDLDFALWVRLEDAWIWVWIWTWDAGKKKVDVDIESDVNAQFLSLAIMVLMISTATPISLICLN